MVERLREPYVRSVSSHALPFVDEHSRRVPASAESLYAALLTWVEANLLVPAPKAFATLWHLDSPSGFTMVERVSPERIVLRGEHRFARYELAFAIESGAHGTTLRATTHAEFPGLLGTIYRGAVIATGGHAVVVRGMLRRIGRRATAR